MIVINPNTRIGSIHGYYVTNGTFGANLAFSARDFCGRVLSDTEMDGNVGGFCIGNEVVTRSDIGDVFRALDAFDRF